MFVDNMLTEAYWQGGRTAMLKSGGAQAEAVVAVSALHCTAVLVGAKVWAMGSIWVSTEDVVRQPLQ